MRDATLPPGAGALLADEAAYPLPEGLTVGAVVGLGLDRALEVAATAVRGQAIPFAYDDLVLPYNPPSVRDFVTFESHVEGVRRSVDGASGVPEAWYDAPTFYFTNPHALYGPGPIRKPRRTNALDFEMEVGAVMGPDLGIFGYTIVNDWSARDIQSREMKVGLGPAKGKDFATSIGPWIVTADELAVVYGHLDVDCRAYVNDELIGQDRLSHMHWTSRDGRLRRPRLGRLAGRPACLGYDGWRRLPGRAVGSSGRADPAAPRGRRRRALRGRGARHAHWQRGETARRAVGWPHNRPCA